MIKQPILFFALLFFIPNGVFAQTDTGRTFKIEELKRPADLLREWNSNEVIDKFAPQQIVYSQMPPKMVDALAHPFFDGMYMAYSDHRPVIISPDMIWLLICQGFSHHVNNNTEALRNMFVDFDGKKSLLVRIDNDQPLNSLSTWEKVIPQFVQQVSDNTSKELMANLTPDFSTTTSNEKIATQITAMEAMHPYFEYIVLRIMCGIPEITIKGTPEDWQLLKDKADSLRKYKLDWWIDELHPVLDQFINASNGNFNKAFWRNMFKYHTEEKYGAPKVIDGWIIKFYPYDKKGKRNDFKMLRSSENLPDEQAVVDFKRIDLYPDGHSETFPMQFVAGFFGLKQNRETQALEPIIGWLVTPKDTSDQYTSQIARAQDYDGEITIRVSEIPKEILKLPSIKGLSVEFIDSIKIPAALSLIDISHLSLNGQISEQELNKIDSLFPYTIVTIRKDWNSDVLNRLEHLKCGNIMNGSLYYTVDKISQEHWKCASLYSSSKEIEIPEAFENKTINIIAIDCDDITPENKQKIIDQFPDSYLTINDERIKNRQYYSAEKDRKERYEQWKLHNPE